MLLFKNTLKWMAAGLSGLFLAGLWVASTSRTTAAASLAQSAAEGKTLFDQKCVACHTVGGGQLVGPDLQGVTNRRELTWIKGFIAAPDQVLASGDPIATQLLAENNNIPMPNLGLSQMEIDALMAYLENPEASAQSESPAPAPSVAGDPTLGQELFSGVWRLQNGGTTCIACHSVDGVGALNGGSLGPDLTHVFQRYGDTGLASALQSLPFPSMQAIFLNSPLTPEEQAHLHAFFQQADQQAAQPRNSMTALFLGAGALGAAVLFGVMVFFWPRQRQSLSDKLRQGA